MLNKGSTFSTRVFEWEKYVIKMRNIENK